MAKIFHLLFVMQILVQRLYGVDALEQKYSLFNVDSCKVKNVS